VYQSKVRSDKTGYKDPRVRKGNTRSEVEGIRIRTRAINKEVIMLDVLMQDDDDFTSLENFALKRREKIALSLQVLSRLKLI